MFLSRVDSGNEVILKDIRGGRRLRSRLFSMGLLPGTRVRVLNPEGHGPVMLRVRDSNLAICRKMAEKITVE